MSIKRTNTEKSNINKNLHGKMIADRAKIKSKKGHASA
jgi:hypothetical protein